VFVVRQTEEFSVWLDGLRDVKARVRIAARVRQIEAGTLGDWKSVGGEVGELRVHFGPGYRLIVLLCGGDKSSQQRDVRKAIELASNLGEDL
jgi:putative addiction module killer protein